MKKTNDADMLAAIVRASNRYAMRPALVIDDRTYTYQELFGLAGSICETLRNLKEDIIGITIIGKTKSTIFENKLYKF